MLVKNLSFAENELLQQIEKQINCRVDRQAENINHLKKTMLDWLRRKISTPQTTDVGLKTDWAAP